MHHETRETLVRGSKAERSKLECVHEEHSSPYALCACTLEKMREQVRSEKRWCVEDNTSDIGDEIEAEEGAEEVLYEALGEHGNANWLECWREELRSELVETLDHAGDAGLDACWLEEMEEGLAARTIADWLAKPWHARQGGPDEAQARTKAQALLREMIGQHHGESDAQFEQRVGRAIESSTAEARLSAER